MIHTIHLPRYTDGDEWTAPTEHQGYGVRARVAHDNTDTPWDLCDGHGPVSDWRPIDSKRPGERVLCTDRRSARFYDVAEATRIARREGWGTRGDDGMKPGARAAAAVEADFQYLRGWCNDEWSYLCVAVEVSRNGKVVAEDSCCGIESLNDYWREWAAEQAQRAIDADIKARKAAKVAAARETRERRYWAARDVLTVQGV